MRQRAGRTSDDRTGEGRAPTARSGAPPHPDRRRLVGDRPGWTVGGDPATVAAEAGVPPSAVYYYFTTLDDLVAAALVEVNERFIAQLDGIDTTGDNPLRALAVVTVEAARPTRAEATAELELWMLAARDERLRGEIDRYNASLHATAARFSDDPTAVAAIAAALTGYYWQVATSDTFDAEQLEAILRHIVR